MTLRIECIACGKYRDMPGCRKDLQALGYAAQRIPRSRSIAALCPDCTEKTCPDCGEPYSAHLKRNSE